jgi:hypothetical protein
MWLQMCVCASTAEPDRFLCKLCPGTIQLDVNPVSYFILPDRRTYQRHGSVSLAPDTVQLCTNCKNICIFTDENSSEWENIKRELRGREKSTLNFRHLLRRQGKVLSLWFTYRRRTGHKRRYYVERPDIQNDKRCIGPHLVLEQARYAKGVFMSTICYLRQTHKEK